MAEISREKILSLRTKKNKRGFQDDDDDDDGVEIREESCKMLNNHNLGINFGLWIWFVFV